MSQAYEKFEKARAELAANITLYNLIKGLPETLPNVSGSESHTAEKVALIEVANSVKMYAAAAQGIGHSGAQR
jgi:hypothetical protein